ncbi:MAG: hypothetical protein A2293_14545 [Elusimicrobia bacterium RIFOXYB2_FULL_49_7]|nr:MAG: hypothetical protein A2293_14545 [Elusimicrobia bacterium RIFOXYB2_FULL_49_7]
MARTRILLSLLCSLFLTASGADYSVIKPSGLHSPLPGFLSKQAIFSEKDAWLAGKVVWEKVQTGLSLGQLTLERKDSTRLRLFLLKVDTASYGFKVLGQSGEGRPVEEWAKEAGCLAAINAGYFYYRQGSNREKSPLGLTVQNGKSIAPFRENYSGCFIVDKKGAHFLYQSKPVWDVVHAVQSFPMLIYKGRIPEPLKKERKGILHIHRRHRCSAVGMDWKGNIILFITAGEASFFEMAFLSGALGLRECLALDGGGSTQMAILSSPPSLFPGLENVPFAIGVYSK